MESKATLYGISRDFKTNKPIVSFLIDSLVPEADLSGDLRLTVRRWKERRSLDANGYMWVLLTQMALALGSTKEEVYEEMLDRYGKEFRDEDGGMVAVGVKKNLDMIVANNLKVAGAGFGGTTNVVTIITEKDIKELPLMGKDEVAAYLLDEIQRRRFPYNFEL